MAGRHTRTGHPRVRRRPEPAENSGSRPSQPGPGSPACRPTWLRLKRGLCRRLAARGGGDCAVDDQATCTSPGSPPSPSRVPASGTAASASESVTASKRACCNDDRDGNWTYCRRYAGEGKRSRERRGLAGQAEWFKRKTGAQEVNRTPREASEAQSCSVQHCRPGAFSNPLPQVQQIRWRPPGTQWVSCGSAHLVHLRRTHAEVHERQDEAG